MKAIALTDHGSMYGAIEFYKECKKAEIKPIIGVEAYIAERTRLDKEPGLDSKRYHLTLLARNEKGYKNLMTLVTKSNLEGYYYKPRMDEGLLKEYGEGIICLSGCPASRFVHHIKNGNDEEAKKLLNFYIECFGRENVFVEIMKHDEVDWYVKLHPKIIEIAQEMSLPIVGTWDSHYLHEDDNNAQDTLVAINTGTEVGKSGMSMKEGNYSFVDSKKAKEAFANIPGAWENTSKVAELVNLEIDLGNLYFPTYELPEGQEPNQVLRDMAIAGMKRLEIEGTESVIKRLDYELEVIKMKGYPSYFLVMADLIKFARSKDILTNTRGSAAGSFVSYCCGITNVNPIEYNLPFERFLNPYRPSPPDIDLDIADDRRDEMIEYAKEKYGADRVAQIGTFGTMMARGAVRDVARALGYPYATGDRISKMIPMGSQGFPMTLLHALEITPELKTIYDTERDGKIIIDMAKKLEGGARHISVHAAGVVIAPRPITEFTPVQFDPKGGKIITQYDMYSIEDAGLPKFDFLGIRNLSFLAESIKLVKKIYNIDIDIDRIPLDDKKTFQMLARGDTEGVFQLNGSGMTKELKGLKPTTIHDINVMVALYRPGPMATIEEYVARKHGKKPITYYHPKMRSFLAPSLGLLVYQDDLLFTAMELAGYDWGEVDKFRKAVGKKIPEEMAKQHVRFVEGCQKHSNMSKKEAEFIWTLFEPFQGYGFNKAHAASYGKLAYETAYMKANYPVAYMTAMLTAESGDVETIGTYIGECKRMGLTVLPPDINESYGGFTVASENGKPISESNVIRFGLYTIKNLGTDIANAIIEERKKGGHFTSIVNFLERIKHKNLNKKSLEALIKSGATDELGERGFLLANMEAMQEFNRELSKEAGNQISLFGDLGANAPQATLDMVKVEPATQTEKLAWEKELLGLYISGHPLDKIREKLESKEVNINKIKESGRDEQVITVGGMIEDVRIVITKKNDRMAFIKIMDFTGSIEAVVFPKAFVTLADILVPEACVAISGKVSVRNGEKSIVIEKAKKIEV
jgi:DNA polymerase-3 subunit alpha